MDGRHVEPGPGLHEGEPWLQILLRGAVSRLQRLQRCAGASWRLQNAFCRASLTSGCRRHSNSGCGSNICPDGIEFDGKGFVGTGVTAPAFSYLRTIEDGDERMVDLTGIEPVTS